MKLRTITIVFQVVLWAISLFLVIGIWLLKIEFPYEAEPLTVLIGLITIAVTAIESKLINQIEIEKYSSANVLAKGYVENFVEPTLTQLIKKNKIVNVEPILYIYIPKKLSEITQRRSERIKSEIKLKTSDLKTIQVKLDEGRGLRDVMSVSQGDNIFFVDIPNTLYALNEFVEYRINSPRNSLCQKKKDEVGQKYIDKFKCHLILLLKEKGLLKNNIRFIDSSLNFN